MTTTPTATISTDIAELGGVPSVHELKTDPAVFDAVARGDKTHEIRLNDRNFQVGDTLLLRETVHTGAHMASAGLPLLYTCRTATRTVSHIQTGYGLADGWCILSFRNATRCVDLDALLAVDQKLVDAINDCDDGRRRASFIALVKSARDDLVRIWLPLKSAAPVAPEPAAAQDNPNWLLSDMDAMKWANEFCRLNPRADHGLMLSWFSCAIMTGFDEANRRNASAATEPATTQHPDDVAIDRFAAAMKRKMASSRAKGRSGWDNAELCPVDRLQTMLVDHLAKGDPVDVGNFAMMLYNRNEHTVSPQPLAEVSAAQAVPEGVEYEAEDGTISARRDGALLWHAHIYGNAAEIAEEEVARKVVARLRATPVAQPTDTTREA